MLNNNFDLRYETPYNVPFDIMQCYTNIMVTLQCGAIKIRYNIRFIKPYTSDTNVEYIKC